VIFGRFAQAGFRALAHAAAHDYPFNPPVSRACIRGRRGAAAIAMGRLTTHVLDASQGRPGRDILIELYRVEGAELRLLARTRSNEDGRCDAPLLEGQDYRSGVYQLHFHAGDYYRACGIALAEPAFLDVVVLRFGIDAAQEHYHVPLLISPYSYSTYRGS